MTARKQTKSAIVSAVLVLVLLFTSLIGTTFAWFTDEVTSSGNKIQSGNLKVDLELLDKESGEWKSLKDDKSPIFNYDKWEPGYTDVKLLKVDNEGSLSLIWKAAIVSYGEISELADVIDVYVRPYGVTDDPSSVQYPADRDLTGYTYVGTAREFIDGIETTTKGALGAGESAYLGLALKMRESAGNEYQGLSLGGSFDIVILATQGTVESDSFGKDYDVDAVYPTTNYNYRAKLPFSAELVDADGALLSDVTLGGENNGLISAKLPGGVKTNGSDLTLKVDTMSKSGATFTLEENETALSLDVHIDGIDESNTVATLVTIKQLLVPRINSANIRLYHVEDGVTNAMTLVSLGDLDAHNEFYYDYATGDVVLALASFSEIAIVAGQPDPEYNPAFPTTDINVSSSAPVSSEIVNEEGALTEKVEITVEDNETASAVVPEGVKMSGENLVFSVQTIKEEDANANITLSDSELMLALDVHIEGVDESNTVPMLITLKELVIPGLNEGNVKIYHVENGETVEMTPVALADLDAHNEFYYNAATGDVILSMASFSAVVATVDGNNDWTGESATAFNSGTGTEADPYIIATAGQLAFFRDVVDGKAEWNGDRSFKGQYVVLANDIILNHHDETETPNQFDPIGWGYDNSAYNAGSAPGKVFMGTFDGDKHAIHGLYQNGWDLETKTGTDYTYTNCGFGLFASVQDATIKNLTMKHANVTVECVEAGIVVGLAQGNCTFENIYVYHGNIANYQRPAGGVVGEVSPKYEDGQPVESTHRFINVHVGSSTTVGTLWGDFDAPCGGVIGAYWADSSKTKVYMKDVDVSCVLDVYSDVTSAYQWYAYRRAGMLIGNTDRSKTENGRTVAAADYLTCENCVVIYDDWRNYTYCEFTNQNNVTESGFNAYNYPWVRVEPGRNNPSYSNPRYGHPVDAAGNSVIDDIHLHEVGDGCMTLIQFNQLYGGGQGVYGNPTHTGVVEGKYTITFIGADGDIADVKYISNNGSAVSLEGLLPKVSQNGEPPLRWEDANGEVYATYNNGSWTYNKSINAGNLVDYVFYPEWPGEFNIYFLDHNGKTLYYEIFTEGQSHTLNFDAIEAQRLAIQKELDDTENVIQVKWKIGNDIIDKNQIKTYNFGFNSAKNDITVKIELALSTTSITLTPQYDATTNQLISYHVTDVNQDDSNKSINIPSHVGNVPVDEIDSGAFDGFDNLTAVKIPSTMTKLGAGMFPGSLFSKQTVTIYYTGTLDQWNELIKNSGDEWDDGLGDGSRVFFLDANNKVDISKGYVEYYKKNIFNTSWYHHAHEYLEKAPDGCPAAGHYKGFTDYDAEGRPDRDYWIA